MCIRDRYYIACLLPVNKDRYFCVMTHDASDDSSVGVVVKAIKKKYPNAVFTYVKKEDRKLLSLAGLIFVKAVYLAVSGTVLMDNAFLPLAYTKIRKNVNAVSYTHLDVYKRQPFVTACSKRNQAEIQKVISRNSVDSY